MGITPLPRYYGHSDFPPGLLPGRDLRVYAHSLPSIPPPSTPCPSVAASSLPHKPDRLPALADTWLHLFYAGSPKSSGRIGFVFLRTGRSPPVAPHLASRQRSYSRLQAGERLPEEDFHLSDYAYSHAHVAAPFMGAAGVSSLEFKVSGWKPASCPFHIPRPPRRHKACGYIKTAFPQSHLPAVRQTGGPAFLTLYGCVPWLRPEFRVSSLNPENAVGIYCGLEIPAI